MAIPCTECHEPVHPNAVTCPHCGKPSGVPTTQPTRAEMLAMAQIEKARFLNQVEIASRPTTNPLMRNAHTGYQSLVDVIDATIEYAQLDSLILARDPSVAPAAGVSAPAPAKLPVARAREHARPPTAPVIETTAPEPALTAGDPPRFLK